MGVLRDSVVVDKEDLMMNKVTVVQTQILVHINMFGHFWSLRFRCVGVSWVR